jgi:Acetyltransferase (GNAT) family
MMNTCGEHSERREIEDRGLKMEDSKDNLAAAYLGRSSILHSPSSIPLPSPRVALNIRAAVAGDLPFIDRLQKMHTKAVGWMPTNQLEGCIKLGRMLIAEESVVSGPLSVVDGRSEQLTTDNGQLTKGTPVGYLLAADRYFKRDDVGIIYQMNVLPEKQRGLVAANLLKAQFERSAYGCKLYCCWCAQDLAANRFWEAMGFVPLAFRTGGTASGKKPARMHIFWQKRIRQGDETTPWWFPGETTGGAIKENRIVLPIPPGTHWSDAKPIVLPGELSVVSGQLSVVEEKKAKRVRKPKKELVVVNPSAIASGGLRFAAVVPSVIEEKVEIKEKKQTKNDPRLVAAARELKDRWLEQVNGGLYLPMANGKYEVSRGIGERVEIEAMEPVRRLVA